MGEHDEQQWSEFLDEEDGPDTLFIKYKYSKSKNKVVEFVIVYLTTIDGKKCEVVKYDFSEKESLHIHNYCRKPPTKRFLDQNTNASSEENFEELFKYAEEIKKNWRMFKVKYLESR